jgi:hypothetical protein
MLNPYNGPLSADPNRPEKNHVSRHGSGSSTTSSMMISSYLRLRTMLVRCPMGQQYPGYST